MCPSATHWTLWAGVAGQERTQRGAFFEDYTLAEAWKASETETEAQIEMEKDGKECQRGEKVGGKRKEGVRDSDSAMQLARVAALVGLSFN